MGRCPGSLLLPVLMLLGLPYLPEAQVPGNMPPLPYLLIHGAPLGNNNVSDYNWRERRDVKCAADEHKHPSGAFCCKMCIKGFRKVSDCKGEGQVTECKHCESGSYTEVENYRSTCMLCETCREGFGQVVKAPCTSSSNVVCGCPDKMFKVSIGNDFKCEKCRECINGKPSITCGGYTDTMCQCNNGFFNDVEVPCRPCNECRTEDCRHQCPLAIPVEKPAPGGTPPYLLGLIGFLSICLLLMGFLILWKFCRKTPLSLYNTVSPPLITGVPTSEMENGVSKPLYLPCHPVICTETEVPLCAAPPCPPNLMAQLPDCVSDAGRTQLPEDPRVLYAVVDTVPPRRWKEFIRRLGLSDYDIDLIEIQNRNYRDGQYEMLQKWRCRTGAAGSTVEVISRVLREMDLSGCSEAIQDSLHFEA
ncbi:tumor necrosis factor receptor superfamily member 1A-like [Ambystoma mexicanum]|uniref:tumor necrosis factor receptor superfamily member 1A-like n=1 Tax=Ambystoma mexicanum TaxID=8296 RepID=UPI0037E7AF68